MILSALPAPATAGRPINAQRQIDAVPVFTCDFGERWDVNYDRWPDRWTRETGPKLPHYVNVQLVDDPTASAGRCIQVQANGGNVLSYTPPIDVTSLFGYVAEARLKVSGLRHSRVRIRVELCDRELKVLKSIPGEWIRNTKGWTTVRIRPVNPRNDKIELARIAFELQQGEHADLSGSVSLDDVWFARLPKMTVTTNSPFNVYTDLHDVEVTCELSGIRERNPDIHFELLDASSSELSNDRQQLQGRLIHEKVRKASEMFGTNDDPAASYVGSSSWKPQIEDFGFYRVRVTMETDQGPLDQRVVNIAVAPPLERQPTGEFGWSLHAGRTPLGFAELGELLPKAAVHWVKLPVWYSPEKERALDELVIFAEQLAAQDVETVAVIDRPPQGTKLAKEISDKTAIADALSGETSAWLPSLDPILTRLSLRVRWWQLGYDHDTSFSGLPDLEKEIDALRASLFRFGQDVKLGIAWNWLIEQKSQEVPTWEFQQFTATPALTGNELAEYLKLPAPHAVHRWVLIEPLPRSQYDLHTRARDLVEQMLAAKINGAEAAFAVQPFDNERGLMTQDGTPSDLLLPWRTTASLLSGAEFLGSLKLPNGSMNQLFQAPNGEVVMVAWNSHPTQEVLYLGEKITEIDMWGKRIKVELREGKQVLQIDTLPTFIRGLHPAITRWRLSVQIDEKHVPSIFGKAHENTVRFRNHFRQGAGGTLNVVAPEGWRVGPHDIEFKMGVGGNERELFDLTLPFDANSGRSDLRLDFKVSTDKDYKFSVFRSIDVGDGMVRLSVESRLNQHGELIVLQRMVNTSAKPVDFKCLLFAKGHRRQRTHVFQLGSSEDQQVYRLKNGQELLGTELWLRAEEVHGSRVLNHRFIAEQ